MTTPNAELAYAVLDQIDAHPETWRQGTWDCGTAACFAGWAVRLAGGKTDGFDSAGAPIVVDGPEELVGLAVPQAAVTALRSNCISPNGADLFDGLLNRDELGRLVAETFGTSPGPKT